MMISISVCTNEPILPCYRFNQVVFHERTAQANKFRTAAEIRTRYERHDGIAGAFVQRSFVLMTWQPYSLRSFVLT